MKRQYLAMVASVCAFSLTPAAALAGGNQDQGAAGLTKQVQSATNKNSTEQSAGSEASSRQTNVNAPISILSYGSNNGNVTQGNNATTKSSAGNSNQTEQGNRQSQGSQPSNGGGQPCNGGSQGGSGSGQSQHATNNNSTEQDATSEATSKQVNVNAPVSILSYGANNGDVNQTNNATTTSSAHNSNQTEQGNQQSQKSGPAEGRRPCDHKRGEHGNDQRQSAQNNNETQQEATSSAHSEQKNVNKPFSFLSFGGGNGPCGNGSSVTQVNNGTTRSTAGNSNATEQGNKQSQR